MVNIGDTVELVVDGNDPYLKRFDGWRTTVVDVIGNRTIKVDGTNRPDKASIGNVEDDFLWHLGLNDVGYRLVEDNPPYDMFGTRVRPGHRVVYPNRAASRLTLETGVVTQVLFEDRVRYNRKRNPDGTWSTEKETLQFPLLKIRKDNGNLVTVRHLERLAIVDV